jgi:hypothetical protein
VTRQVLEMEWESVEVLSAFILNQELVEQWDFNNMFKVIIKTMKKLLKKKKKN